MSPGNPDRPRLSVRAEAVPAASTLAMAARARALRAEGRDVISLAIGEPDFPTPPHAIEAAMAAARAGDTRYPPVDGAPALKAAVARKFRRDHGLDYAPGQILVANGAKQVIFDALLATLDPGSEVILPAPYWSAYGLMTRLLDGVPVILPPGPGFKPRPEALAAAITPRTRWLFLNSPNNPSGAALSRAELAALGAVLLRHPHVRVLCDDMYEHLVYDGFAHATLAQAEPRLMDRVLTVGGVSKTYAMTGWRVGFAGGPAELVRAMARMQGQATSGVCTLAQAAAAAALDGPQELVAARAAEYQARRDAVLSFLAGIPGLRCHRPEGAFYLFPDIGELLGRRSAGGHTIDTDEDFASALLEEQGVAIVAGSGFGLGGHARISYAAAMPVLEEACGRIAAFCAKLN